MYGGMEFSAPSAASFAPNQLVTALKAVAEPTRLRILMLLAASEHNVKDLTQILGQSQPRLSRHLKLLTEAGLIERFREGSWVYFHVSDRTPGGQLAQALLKMADHDDSVLALDQERATGLRRQREATAQDYFERHAGDWDRIRALHVSESDVEAAMVAEIGRGPFETFVDLGTGTGRILQLFEGCYRYGIGLDVNQSMLAYARSKLAATGLLNAQLRHGDLYNIPLPTGEADAVVMHQVLHFLSEPARAIAEAARVLKTGGRLLIVDFSPHTLEFLREQHAHERLGFADDLMEQWCKDAGFTLKRTRKLATSQPVIGPTPQSDHHATANEAVGREEGSAFPTLEGLTVSLWVAERQPDHDITNDKIIDARSDRSPALEEIE